MAVSACSRAETINIYRLEKRIAFNLSSMESWTQIHFYLSLGVANHPCHLGEEVTAGIAERAHLI